MDFTVVIVSFKSFHIIEEHIKAIDKKNKIIIVENSLDKDLKLKLEKNYSNVTVIIPEENLGYGRALNLGIEKSLSKFVFCMVADLNISKECFLKIENILDKFTDFSIISPTYFDESIYKNYTLKKNQPANITISDFLLKEVDEIDGAILIINKNKFSSKSIMDDKIFLYFENTDLCLRLKKNNQKMYVIENLKFKHLGRQSSHPKYQKEILISRNWHYCWSKFYFYKKHYNYFYALIKTFPNLLRAIKYYVLFRFKNDDYNSRLHKSELSGLFNAYLMRKSHYRPKIN